MRVLKPGVAGTRAIQSHFERAIAPGIREHDLLAVLSGTLLRRGREHLATSTGCPGPNTNPWRARTTARPPPALSSPATASSWKTWPWSWSSEVLLG